MECMTYDDLLFYLPALGSFAFIGISVVLGYLLARAVRAWKKRRPVEKSEKS